MTPSRRARTTLTVAAVALLATTLAHAQGVEAPRVPLRTAIKEINTLRSEYADGYNRKAAASLTAMYLLDAVVIRPDGSTLLGQSAIGKAMAEESPTWQQTTIVSDTMRVFGNTAWDVGTFSTQVPEGNMAVSRYLVVLRRGVQEWKISSLAVVPETPATATR
jgi:ketosteroid isomerase-like protein